MPNECLFVCGQIKGRILLCLLVWLLKRSAMVVMLLAQGIVAELFFSPVLFLTVIAFWLILSGKSSDQTEVNRYSPCASAPMKHMINEMVAASIFICCQSIIKCPLFPYFMRALCARFSLFFCCSKITFVGGLTKKAAINHYQKLYIVERSLGLYLFSDS